MIRFCGSLGGSWSCVRCIAHWRWRAHWPKPLDEASGRLLPPQVLGQLRHREGRLVRQRVRAWERLHRLRREHQAGDLAPAYRRPGTNQVV